MSVWYMPPFTENTPTMGTSPDTTWDICSEVWVNAASSIRPSSNSCFI